ncbi:MAG TPA: hypothetical protein VEX13_15695, partial [Chloroflexia bacterium]|nr:hypothetical protein [Chloroflexia bacterium]
MDIPPPPAPPTVPTSPQDSRRSRAAPPSLMSSDSPDALSLSGPPPGGGGTQQNLADLRQLRHVRVELIGLQKLLDIVASGSSSLPIYAGVIKDNVRDIDGLIRMLSFSDYADSVAEIQNTWQLMKVSPLLSSPDQKEPPLDAQTILNQCKILTDQCKRAIFLIGYLTIPSRLNDWLAQAPRGYYVPFDSVFEDEVPDAADRARILKALAWGRQLNGGLVDVTSGLVYKYSTKASVRWISLASVVLALVGSVLLIWAIGNGFWLNITGWPYTPENVPTLIGAWGALLAGILVHIGVGTAKRAQSKDQLPPVFAPADFLARI